jgi:hypothetical protein
VDDRTLVDASAQPVRRLETAAVLRAGFENLSGLLCEGAPMTTRARVLVCVRSFSYVDPWRGRQTMTANRSFVDANESWAAQHYAENFGPTDRSFDVTREGRPIAGANLR